MVKREKLLPVSVVSYMLATALGAGKQWVDALNDYRQQKADIQGFRLYPAGHTGGSPERAGQPLYRRVDVLAFIHQVRGACRTKLPFPVDLEEYDYDDADGPVWTWRARLATRVPKGA
jgi:hypothetical protein